jgi:hypothetical protein
VSDRNCCQECGLDLAEDPDGDHGEGHRLCWSCWDKQRSEPQFTPQDRAKWWVDEGGITDVAQLAHFLRIDFNAVELGDEPPVTDEFLVLAELALQHSAAGLTVCSVQEFTETEEPAAAAVLGTEEAALIAEGGDVMVYGTGGAGKTTLVFDLAFHLAAGREWIGIPVPMARRVLVIENEGPRPMLRRKLRRKLAAWDGELGDRLRVYERPWGRFSFADEAWRTRLAQEITTAEIDVVIAGPVSRIGMEEAGTLQEVRAFTELIADVRRRCGRALTVILVHHENKAHTVSGAWEPSGDTLLHVKEAGNGHTIVHVEKARWDNERHHTTLKLAWAPGESFRPEGERDLLAELVQLLSDGTWRTAKEIAASEEKGGIGANISAVKELLDDPTARFESCTGDAAKALGRHPTAVLWKVSQGSETPETPAVSPGGGGAGVSVSPLKGDTSSETPHLPGLGADSDPQDSRVGGTELTEAAPRNGEGP